MATAEREESHADRGQGPQHPVTDELREHVEKRFAKVGKQVSELAVLEVELSEERNPANPDSQVAEVTLYLKGRPCGRRGASRDMGHAINLVAEELARQVKRHRDKRRGRRERAPRPTRERRRGTPAAEDPPGG